MEPSFWPGTAEGWLVLVGKVGAFAIATAIVIWRIYAQRLNDLKAIHDAHQTEVLARKAELRQVMQDARDELRSREAMRVELKRDLVDETDERKARDEAMAARTIELAQSLHVVMGDVTNLTTEVHREHVAHVEEMGALRLDIEKGFSSIRDQMQAGFAGVLERIFGERERSNKGKAGGA